jgi:multidrug efflux pump subunit AcrB
MKYFLNFFLQRKLLVNLLTAIVFIAGLLTIVTIQKEGIPNISINRMVISTIYPGASPSDIELNVSIVIEDALEEIEGIESIASISKEGLSQVIVEIDPTLDDLKSDDVRRDIERAVDRINNLPKDILERPSVMEIKTSMFPILEINIIGDNEESIRKMADKLDLKLKRANGVSKISRVGYKEEEIRVEINPKRLRETETSIMELINVINANNIRLSGGTLETTPKEMSIVTVEEIRNVEDVQNIIIRANFAGKKLRLKDVANIVRDYKKQTVYPKSNGKSAISISIQKKENADILKTIKEVKKVLDSADWEEGTYYLLSNDLSTYTRNRLSMVINNGLIGMVMVFLLLWLFLDFRTAIWTSFGIPFSFLLAFIFFPRIGLSINALSLGGLILVLGMLVDDAIIVAENIHKYKEEGKTSKKYILEAVYDIVFPVCFAIITSVVAFSPLLFLPGIMGKFVFSVPAVVILVLLASLFESLFILPSHLSSDKHNKKDNNNQNFKNKKVFIVKLENFYRRVLIKVLNNKYKFLLFIIILFVASIVYAKFYVPFYFVSREGTTEFTIRMEAPIGTSLEKTLEKVRPIEDLVSTLPKKELSSFSTRVGYDSMIYWQDLGTDVNKAIIYVYLTPYKQRDRTAEQIMDELRSRIASMNIGLDNVVLSTGGSNGPQAGSPIAIQLLSNNDEQRENASNELIAFLKNMKGTLEIEDDIEIGKEELRLIIDNEKVSMLGLDLLSIAATLRTAFSGTKITAIREGNNEIDLTVRLASEYRKDKDSLLNLPIMNREGKLIRVNNFAKLQLEKSIPAIVRYDRLRSTGIEGNVDNELTTPIQVMRNSKIFIDDVLKDKYPEVSFEFRGESQATMSSFADIGKLFLIAIISIYFILILAFGSIVQPILVMTAIPLSIIPVILAFSLHNTPLTFQALVGFVGLAGVVVNDSLVMVTQIKKLADKTGEICIDCVVEGAVSRLRPIILTTITTVVGVVPMIYGWGGYDEYLMPMAMALGYGLLGASFLTLFVVPCFSVIIEGTKNKRK